MMAKPLRDEGDMIVCLTMSAKQKGGCDRRSQMMLTREKDWDNPYAIC